MVTGGLSVMSGGLHTTNGLTVRSLGMKITKGITVQRDGVELAGTLTVVNAGMYVCLTHILLPNIMIYIHVVLFDVGIHVLDGGVSIDVDGLHTTGGLTVRNGGMNVTGGNKTNKPITLKLYICLRTENDNEILNYFSCLL